MFLAHPNGRAMGEGAYVQATDNMGLRAGSLIEFITTNVKHAAPLTREAIDAMFAWAIWRL